MNPNQSPQLEDLTSEQQSAFNALNTLQRSTDEQNRLYSTFANIDQDCYPPDTTLTITQSQLLTAMMQFVKANCKKLNFEERDKLAASAVLAQKEYTILHCGRNTSANNYEDGPPKTGTWILPAVLDRRDVILVW